MSDARPAEPAAVKRALRRELLARRAARAVPEPVAATALSRHTLGLADLRPGDTVAAYADIPGEPSTGILLDALTALRVRILLPVLRADDDLDWAEYRSGANLNVGGRRALREPAGPLLGRDAVRAAHLLIVPALAVSARGDRLGRGGGSYDRVLDRVQEPSGADAAVPDRSGAGAAVPLVVALVWTEELDLSFPVEPHDRPVHAVVTPAGGRLL